MGNLIELGYIKDVNETLLVSELIICDDTMYKASDNLQHNMTELSKVLLGSLSMLDVRTKICDGIVKCLADMLVIYKHTTNNTNADYLACYETLGYLEILWDVMLTSRATDVGIDRIPINILSDYERAMLMNVMNQFIATSDIYAKISTLDRVLSIYLVVLGMDLNSSVLREYIIKNYV